MKRYLYFAIGTVLSAAGFLSVAHGQIVEPVKFHAPMAFHVGTVPMEAGEYTIRNLNESNNTSVLLIEPDHGRACVAMVEKIDTPDHGRAATTVVKLTREGDAMHLTNIWIAGDSVGYKILEGKVGESAHAPSASGN